MKTFNLITLVLSFSFLICAFTIIDNDGQIVNSLVEDNSSEGCSCSTLPYDSNNSDMVLSGEAEKNIDLYELGQRMMPEQYKWDSDDKRSLIFKSKPISFSDSMLIAGFPLNPNSLGWYTLDSRNSLAQSYFIKIEDINKIRTAIKKDSCSVNGARIYMAYEPGSDNLSHVYIGPSFLSPTNALDPRQNHDYYLGNSSDPYLLDLTTPCPNACAEKERTHLPTCTSSLKK
jgi:hypothetical protein